MDEKERLKIKCNQYAKRLVRAGENDVEWETSGTFLRNSPEIKTSRCACDHIANEKASEAKRITAKLTLVLYEKCPYMKDSHAEWIENKFARILREEL